MFRLSKQKSLIMLSILLQTFFFSFAEAQTTTPTWTTCAQENGTCKFSGTREVRYGAGTSWITKTVTESIACTNAAFGSDPIRGTVKSCQYSSVDQTPAPTPVATWSTCATEGGKCSFTGTREVRYGAGTSWITKTFSAPIVCSTTTFGSDPIRGTVKTCEVSSIDTSSPTTPGAWTACASENGACSFSGTREVRFGAEPYWSTKVVTNATFCTTANFGDPYKGVAKTCQYSSTVLPAPTPRVLRVCASGCAYTLPSQAMAAAIDSDIIEVNAGTYNDCFSVNKNNIVVRGVNGRAHLDAKMCDGKGSIVTNAMNFTVENLEFSNMYVSSRNGAGIRHQGYGLVVRNSHFHDGENGILSGRGGAIADPLDKITIENSRFEHLGAGGQAHGVYFGTSSQVTVKNSMFLASKEEGHEFKSRARNTSIECSYIGGLDGLDSYSLNFPDGGVVTVKNSVVEQGPFGANTNIIDYGSEYTGRHPVNTFNLSNVTVINDLNGGAFFIVRNSTQFGLSNATIIGAGKMYASQVATSETGTLKFASRAAAGIPAYPSFPKPAACTGTIGLSN